MDLFLAANRKDITDVKSIPLESMDSDHRLTILQNNTAEGKNIAKKSTDKYRHRPMFGKTCVQGFLKSVRGSDLYCNTIIDPNGFAPLLGNSHVIYLYFQ